MSEQIITLPDGIHLCVETFGDPAHPAVVLAHGASASMLWWEAGLCRRLADAGRFVIRYDQRDTGRSSTYPVGKPGYRQVDLAEDVLAIMDHLDVEQAHLVGCSMAGGIVLLLGVDHADRFRTLTFMDTTTGDPDLPGPTVGFPERPDDLSSRESQVAYVMDQIRAYDGVSPYYDDAAARRLVEADVDRSTNLVAALTNPYLIEFSGPEQGGFGDVTHPTLVLHGELDPVLPLAHGEAIARAVPGARLVVFEGQGHDLLEHHWDTFVDAVAEHTAR